VLDLEIVIFVAFQLACRRDDWRPASPIYWRP